MPFNTRLLVFIIVLSFVISGCWSYKPLPQNASVKNVVISKFFIEDDATLYQTNNISLNFSKPSKLATQNQLPRSTISAIYDSTVSVFENFLNTRLIPKLEKRNKKYFKEYDLPDYNFRQASKTGKYDGCIEIYAKLKKRSSTLFFGITFKKPILVLKARMYDSQKKIIWRNKIRFKGESQVAIQGSVNNIGFSLSRDGMTYDQVVNFFYTGMRILTRK